MLRRRLNVSDEISKYFYLFELIEHNFGKFGRNRTIFYLKIYVNCVFFCLERKLRSDEFPHALYIQNYSSAAATCILFKKWLFNVSKEIDLCEKDLFFGDICYWEVRLFVSTRFKSSDCSFLITVNF